METTEFIPSRLAIGGLIDACNRVVESQGTNDHDRSRAVHACADALDVIEREKRGCVTEAIQLRTELRDELEDMAHAQGQTMCEFISGVIQEALDAKTALNEGNGGAQ